MEKFFLLSGLLLSFCGSLVLYLASKTLFSGQVTWDGKSEEEEKFKTLRIRKARIGFGLLGAGLLLQAVICLFGGTVSDEFIGMRFEEVIFLTIVLMMAGAIFWMNRKRNAWDVMFFNTTLAIIALFMIGLLDNGLWKEIVYILGAVALGGGIAGIFRERRR